MSGITVIEAHYSNRQKWLEVGRGLLRSLSLSSVSRSQWGALGLLLILGFVVQLLRIEGVQLSDIQTLVFPFLLVVFYQAARRLGLEIPSWIFMSCFVIGSGFALNVRGYLTTSSSPIVFAELAGDNGGASRREFNLSYREVSSRYHFPALDYLERSFPSVSSAEEWLREYPEKLILIIGRSRSFLLVPQRGGLLALGQTQSDPVTLNVISNYELPADSFVPAHVGNGQLLISLGPRAVSLPQEPIELSRHYLGYLADALGALRIGGGGSSIFRARLLATLGFDGEWGSPVPRAYAHFLLGTAALISALSKEGKQNMELACANRHLSRSLKLLKSRKSPELISAAFNNIAISYAASHINSDDRRRIKSLLKRAMSMRVSRGGNATEGAQIAASNLVLLRRHGLVR